MSPLATLIWIALARRFSVQSYVSIDPEVVLMPADLRKNYSPSLFDGTDNP